MTHDYRAKDQSPRVLEGTLLWRPSPERADRSNIADYMRWLADERGMRFGDYDELWRWSVDAVEEFWASIWDYFGVRSHAPYSRVLRRSEALGVEGAMWFEGATLNYAEHALRHRDERPAIIALNESGSMTTTTYAELATLVAAVAGGLRKLGVGKGDSVAAWLPNTTEAVVAMLAAASIGAAWSSCPPEFGTASVIDRFVQLKPKVLLGVDGYVYNDKPFGTIDALARVQRSLPTLELTVVLPNLAPRPPIDRLTDAVYWEELLVAGTPLTFEPVPFDHPLWVLYSSGTTGPPKAIVHGHGGALLEHLKALSLHLDLGRDDRFFWFSTTGWVMWNILVSGLLVGSTIVLYDGSPAHPDLSALWRVAERARVSCFGVSAPFISACMKAGLSPSAVADLSAVRTVGSTGAPLTPEGYAWVYERVGRDLLLASISGGTDMISAVIMSCALLPVHAGEMQCRALGCKVESFNDVGDTLIDEVGELVITEPMPSMPVRLLNDQDNRLLHESYFDTFPGVWRHGDWLKVTPRGTCVIYGRSDSTLNRSGIRMGTSEFYRVVEELPEVTDSLVIDTSRLGDDGKLLLFVVLADGVELDESLRATVVSAIRASLSPRHVPDEIWAIPEVPRTLNGKKLEVPVKRILSGVDPAEAVSTDALANPDALRSFMELAGLPQGPRE